MCHANEAGLPSRIPGNLKSPTSRQGSFVGGKSEHIDPASFCFLPLKVTK